MKKAIFFLITAFAFGFLSSSASASRYKPNWECHTKNGNAICQIQNESDYSVSCYGYMWAQKENKEWEKEEISFYISAKGRERLYMWKDPRQNIPFVEAHLNMKCRANTGLVR